jgi:hypothetical protein
MWLRLARSMIPPLSLPALLSPVKARNETAGRTPPPLNQKENIIYIATPQ